MEEHSLLPTEVLQCVSIILSSPYVYHVMKLMQQHAKIQYCYYKIFIPTHGRKLCFLAAQQQQ
jgi:hypothetical protein